MKTEKLTREALSAYAAESREAFEALLKDFVEIPSVSVDPTKKSAVREQAKLAAEVVRRFGGTARVLQTEGHPIVVGAWGANPLWPTVTVYNHLDVQPASREAEPWMTEPFTFTKKGDRYIGRGTTDDKGPALTALFGIRAALEAELPVNIRVLWELEEEVGSPSFEKAVAAHADLLATDAVVVSDTIWIARGKPACPAGLRGLQGFLFTLRTGETEQHSGVCGGAARNPMAELMKLVSECFDATTGRVKIPGFYDDVLPPTREELADFRRSGFTVAGFKRDHQLRSLRTADALDVMKRVWALPTFEVHGMTGGYTGPGVKTVIPPHAEVKVSCRLVPNQSAEKVARLVTKFVRSKNRDVVVEVRNRLDPYRGVTEGPLAEAVKRSMKFGFRREPAFVREGGSIGAVLTMEKLLKCPVVFLGLSLPEHGYHAPNESFDWEQASGGMAAFARFFAEAASLGKPSKIARPGPRKAVPAQKAARNPKGKK